MPKSNIKYLPDQQFESQEGFGSIGDTINARILAGATVKPDLNLHQNSNHSHLLIKISMLAKPAS